MRFHQAFARFLLACRGCRAAESCLDFYSSACVTSGFVAFPGVSGSLIDNVESVARGISFCRAHHNKHLNVINVYNALSLSSSGVSSPKAG